MSEIDYYQIMGIDEDASIDSIKKAYRRLARKYHPDVSKDEDAEEKFKQLSAAYDVLKNKEKRAEYDHIRKHGAPGGSWNQYLVARGARALAIHILWMEMMCITALR